MATQGISWRGIGIRVGIAVLLVLATYNPAGFSFFHWLTTPPAGITALKALAGVVLVIGWVICLRTAYVSLGPVGLALGSALLGALVWELVDLKLIDPANPTAMSWVVLVIVGVLLGIGLGWSLVRARTTGQVEVD